MRTRIVTALLLFTLSGWTQAFASDETSTTTKPQAITRARAHDCCPSLHRFFLPLVVPSVPAGLPCGDSHPCCASREPNNPPTLTATSRVGRPDSRIAAFDEIETVAGRCFALAGVCSDATTRSYSKLSTVLRI